MNQCKCVLLVDMKLKEKCYGIPEKEDLQTLIAQAGPELWILRQDSRPRTFRQDSGPWKTDAYTTSKKYLIYWDRAAITTDWLPKNIRFIVWFTGLLLNKINHPTRKILDLLSGPANVVSMNTSDCFGVRKMKVSKKCPNACMTYRL